MRYHSAHETSTFRTFEAYRKSVCPPTGGEAETRSRPDYGRVRSLQMCPINDSFISSGEDGTVRLWDLRSSHTVVSVRR